MAKKELKKYVAPTSEIVEEELEGALLQASIDDPFRM